MGVHCNGTGSSRRTDIDSNSTRIMCSHHMAMARNARTAPLSQSRNSPKASEKQETKKLCALAYPKHTKHTPFDGVLVADARRFGIFGSHFPLQSDVGQHAGCNRRCSRWWQQPRTATKTTTLTRRFSISIKKNVWDVLWRVVSKQTMIPDTKTYTHTNCTLIQLCAVQ